jgi:quinol monooxygenase YgiN
MANQHPIVVVATMKAKPESVEAVREAGKKAVEGVHQEPGCELYSLHEAEDGTFIFVEQWADAESLKTHSGAPAVAEFFGTVGSLLDGAPDVKVLKTIAGGDPAKGQLRP